MSTEGLIQVQTTIQGIRPLLMDNGRMANPFDPLVIMKKTFTDKGSKQKTEEDQKAIADIEVEGSMYWSDDMKSIYIPTENLVCSIWEAAKLTKDGPKITGILIDDDKYGQGFPLVFPNHNNKKKLLKEDQYRLFKMVVIRMNKVPKHRFIVPSRWTCTFNAQITTDILNFSHFESFVHAAGRRKGLGNWRPGSKKPGTYGMFEVTECKIV